ncbi:ABC transporter ATP-binding protein [Gordonibacter massiliensis (ex Traore et al. 2017)]|uniref:ABC transporter ATP-binding protein n=1 Tax=Gordonibacter massiliensis (ex Traore et al. 2017) TaxID=1841863 RepID=A0A842JL55_9ACTN|nr:ABC transporter ATP-binding protein [Gordonibacter massiliensis (ex Traore et al. 2017)]MBC2890435.1 ABC transporter ATP-binding protein [Gordonibacter massiliensis (ex Traore et al. 2017)]
MGSTIVACEVRKSFGTGRGSKRRTVDVLRGVSLAVEAGEMVGIVGPSGSGKSTLLHCLSGLEEADSGSIHLMGRQLVRARRSSLFKTRREHVGFIFQAYNLIPSLSAGENVALPARLAGRPLTKAQVGEALESVGLGGREKSRPGDMSGGEQQRVAVARVLASRPDIVFADEPTGALDSKNGREVLGMLRGIADDPQRSVVMVTHDLEAASLADRVLVLRDGLIARELGRSTAAQILEALGEAA